MVLLLSNSFFLKYEGMSESDAHNFFCQGTFFIQNAKNSVHNVHGNISITHDAARMYIQRGN